MRTIADLMPEIEKAVADSLDGGPCLETAIARMVLGRDPQPEDPQWTPEQRAVFLVAVDLWRPRFHAQKEQGNVKPNRKPAAAERFCATCGKVLVRYRGETRFRKRRHCDRQCGAMSSRRKAS